MKKLFSNKISTAFLAPFLVFLFFLPNLISAKIPIPADALLGLYHPWRDNSYAGYNPGRFPTKNPLITDPILQTYPWRNQVIRNLKEGNLPLWNPYNFSGQPLLANIQSSPLQILNILFFILPFNLAWALQIILPPILVSAFMYFFLRSINLTKTASAFGAFLLPFTGYFLTWMTWGNMVATAMWLPLILLCLTKIFKRFSILWFVLLIFASFQTIVSGFWQTAFYVYLLTFIYLIYQFYLSRDIKKTLTSIFALTLGAIIAAPQILPSLEFISHSAREIDQGYFLGRPDWFLPSQNIIQLIIPDYFGNPATYNYWGIWNYLEFVSFIGIIAFFFAIVFFLSGKKESKLLFALVLIIFILATENPISKILLTGSIPLISTMRPSRIVILLGLFLTIAASFGFQEFMSTKSKKVLIMPFAVVFTALASIFLYTFFFSENFPTVENVSAANIALRNLIFPSLILSGLFLLLLGKILNLPKIILILFVFTVTIFEMFRFAYKFTPFTNASLIFPKTQTTEFLKNQEKPFRILSVDRRVFNSATPSVYKIESIHGYDPLFLKDYAKLVSSWENNESTEPGSFNRIVTPTSFESPITDFLNVKYIVSLDEINESSLIKVFEEGQTKVYENREALSRAFFVDEVVKVENRDHEIEMLLNKNFDLKKKAVSSTFSFAKRENTTSVDFNKYSDQSMTLGVSIEKSAPLIVSNVFYPGWNAYVDGDKVEIKRVNYMFQSVLVQEGNHKVEFKYQPQSFYKGLRLSVLGIILAGLASFFLWRKRFQ